MATRFIDALDAANAVIATYTETNDSVMSWDIPTIFPSLTPGVTYNFVMRTGETAGYTVPSLLLDTLSAGAAYSTRKLRTAYTGPALRVRESGGNTEADIGFTGDGLLDTTALLAHCGANSGFVTTWYDQTGNARHISQATVAQQPRIVNAGVVDVENSRPTIVFDGSQTVGQGDHLFNTSPFMYAAGSGTFYFVMKAATQTDRRIWSEANSGTAAPVYRLEIGTATNGLAALIRNDGNTVVISNGTTLFASGIDNTLRAMCWRDTGSEFSAFRLKATGTPASYTRSGALTLNRFGLGIDMRTTPSAPLSMSMSEAIFFSGVAHDVATREAITDNQSAAFPL